MERKLSSTAGEQSRSTELGSRLRHARTTAGLTGTELASTLAWSQAKISKIETSKQVPSPDDVRQWGTATRLAPEAVDDLVELSERSRSQHRSILAEFLDDAAEIQDEYERKAQTVTRIGNFETSIVPGLLQTGEYARWVYLTLARLSGADPADADAFVGARMRRQQILYESGRTFEFILMEAAIRSAPCPPSTMAQQLDRLLALTDHPYVKLGIIPQGRQLELLPLQGFALFDDVAVVESFFGETEYSPGESGIYIKAMDLLDAQAEFGPGAAALIKDAMNAMSSNATQGT